MKNRIGAYSRHAKDTEVELIGFVDCSGCPSEIGPERLAKQIKNLTVKKRK
ncbi:MAG: CGGC domain-containing protein [Peptococcaceae bacterium]|nr:CGGC domain-containing protein [Peptococcaceae bacterium]